jgi:uncharacterized membrane protein
MAMLLAGLILLLATHSVSILGPGWRDRAVARIGRGPWMGLYSLASLAGLALIVAGFGSARQDSGLIYVPLPPHLALILLLPVFPLTLAAVLPGRIRTAVRHPLTLAILLWSAAHLLVNGLAADVLLFGAFFVWAAAQWLSEGYRSQPRPPARTPSRWNDVIAVVAGLALYAAFIVRLHYWLFGVSPLG